MEKIKYFLDLENITSRKAKKYLQKNPHLFERVISYIKTVKSINTTAEYNILIKKLVTLSKNEKFTLIGNSPLYVTEKFAIKNSKPLTEKTLWGGVALKKIDTEKNYIEKLLVIDKYGVLGFELHKRKYERLQILDGLCIVLYSNHAKHPWKKGRISAKLGVPGDIFEFLPKDEHGILAFTKCVIQEKSTNHLDDLVYIFPTSQFRW